MTHREYRMWIAWLEKDQNEPTLSDWYAMQNIVEVRRVFNLFAKYALRTFPKPMEFQLRPKPPQSPEEKKRAVELTKQVWIARAGGKVRRVEKT
jgi:hypothetical protein